MKTKLEYIWLDGYKPTQSLRSKTLVKTDFGGTLDDCPMWAFDGSSTEQAAGNDSDCLLKPVCIFPDPDRKNAYLVMTEVLNADGSPHVSNGRATIDDDDEENNENSDTITGKEPNSCPDNELEGFVNKLGPICKIDPLRCVWHSSYCVIPPIAASWLSYATIDGDILQQTVLQEFEIISKTYAPGVRGLWLTTPEAAIPYVFGRNRRFEPTIIQGEILRVMTEVIKYTGIKFNSIFMNFISEGKSIPPHADDEVIFDNITANGKGSVPIATISLLGEATLKIYTKQRNVMTINAILPNSIYFMGGNIQTDFLHGVENGPQKRASLTFRIVTKLNQESSKYHRKNGRVQPY